MCYVLMRKFLFQLNPETAHYIALKSLQMAHYLGLTKLLSQPLSSPRQLMGLSFPNPIGLAAGFDKNGDYLNALAALGFGFIEIGTVTPRPQPGNPRPRLFRLKKEEAIINRLGFNNKGVDHLIQQMKKTELKGILGINIGKNSDTPLEKAIDDYQYCFRHVAPWASYVTINISSPNTPELRTLQYGERMRDLLQALKKEQAVFLATQHRYVPLVIKISPDLTDDELHHLANCLLIEKIDAVIATNTTLDRDVIKHSPLAIENGGLSGKPLSQRSTTIIEKLHVRLQDKIPIIASGGVMSEQDVLDKMAAGAALVQVYTGLIYQGPSWVTQLIKMLHD